MRVYKVIRVCKGLQKGLRVYKVMRVYKGFGLRVQGVRACASGLVSWGCRGRGFRV